MDTFINKSLLKRIERVTKGRILTIHNPFNSRYKCRLRLVINTYVGCPNWCMYCYTYSYTPIIYINNPKSKKEFIERINEDIEKYVKNNLPKLPVYVSSNCEAFHPLLEDKFAHTLYALQRLKEFDFPTIIMTKFPSKLLENPYLNVLNNLKVIIQVTIPFMNNRFEPFAPHPKERIRAVRDLSKLGFKTVVRVDPLIPTYKGVKGQSKDEINSLISELCEVGVKHIVAKCLRLSSGIKKIYPEFYNSLKPYYERYGYRESPSVWVLNDKVKIELLMPVYEACIKYRIGFSTCMDQIESLKSEVCDGSEEILNLP
ncbi:MAG: hypothetical protein QW372_05620 [Nitrososphaerales archaeon]